MKNSEIKKILAKVYELDSKMDDWMDCHSKALEEGNNDKAAACAREYDRLAAMLHGMTMAFYAIGYRLSDTGDGYWKLIKIKESEDENNE